MVSNDEYCKTIIKELIIGLDIHEQIYWSINKEGEIKAFFICNDIFYWATADGVDIEIKDIPGIKKIFKEFDGEIDEFDKTGERFMAILLWCARKRKMRPQGAYYKHIPNNLHPLFDACGPERTIDIWNPKDQDDNYKYKAKA